MFPKQFTPPPLRISILVLPETAPMAVYGLYEVLGSVGKIWPQLTGETEKVRGIVPRIVAKTAEPFQSVIGVPITPQASISDDNDADVVIVCDIELPLRGSPEGRWAEEIAWARAALARGALVCSTCSGSVLLAEAGLLDGCDAASHWSAAELFRDRYTRVRFRPDRILCDSGHEGRLLTAGGASSWQDLSLYLIGRYCGSAEAMRAAKIFLIGDRSGGQLPFAAMTRPRQHDDAVIAESQTWIADHYPEPNPVTRMVAQSGLAERTFKRRFTNATGYTPVDYVQAIRIEEAKQMLETTRDSIDGIAAEVGYEDPTFFRRLFKRITSLSPAQYRQRFQTAGIRQGA
ncbi:MULTISPECIES: helix-turn-helix domain-containing protein [unclassified Rhizobium]|uniref:GlxA family transcriptional regulator n=1 Tax=unclassified Rhizobium TaxID=2613769 RepID=UPI000AED074E|nr:MULTISPECIES: helix-turn-helix domain-containing protein [unclassified Rhizobium]